MIRPLGTELYERSKCGVMILKVGERGAMVFRSRQKRDVRNFFTLDSFTSRVVDPVGAGDALLAYAALGLAVTKNSVVASILGNCAAAVECEANGNVPVRPSDVLTLLETVKKKTIYSNAA